jgi:hypothetical protein
MAIAKKVSGAKNVNEAIADDRREKFIFKGMLCGAVCTAIGVLLGFLIR